MSFQYNQKGCVIGSWKIRSKGEIKTVFARARPLAHPSSSILGTRVAFPSETSNLPLRCHTSNGRSRSSHFDILNNSRGFRRGRPQKRPFHMPVLAGTIRAHSLFFTFKTNRRYRDEPGQESNHESFRRPGGGGVITRKQRALPQVLTRCPAGQVKLGSNRPVPKGFAKRI